LCKQAFTKEATKVETGDGIMVYHDFVHDY